MTAIRPLTLSITTRTVAETQQLGHQIGQSAPPGLVIALHGDLGAGKTALTQGLATGLGVTARVTSPTFTLIHRYTTAGGPDLVHIDCYRLSDDPAIALHEASTLGLTDILADDTAMVVIEWAERIAPLLPADHLAITLTPVPGDEGTRQMILNAHGRCSAVVLAALE
jgi:tRNA threonylcarbamoyladenosine biosynthesis protein TsaE